MNESLDYLINSLNTSSALTVNAVLLAMLMAFVLGTALSVTYVRTHTGLSFSRTFSQSLVVLCMIVSLVMLVIGHNVVTAFGLLGALAIIRFRNVLKDTRDTSFIFLAVVVGLAVGSGRYMTALVGTPMILFVFWLLHVTSFGTQGRFDGHLSLTILESAESMEAMRATLRRYCSYHPRISRSVTDPAAPAHHVYQVRLRDRDRGSELLADLKQVEGVHGVNLTLDSGLSEA
jgi:uncharacterized membrane protein YhiD involved in acid resistance